MTIARHPERDSRRLHRIALILQAMLDTAIARADVEKAAARG